MSRLLRVSCHAFPQLLRPSIRPATVRYASESPLFGPRSRLTVAALFDRQNAAHQVRMKLLERVSASPEAQRAMLDLLQTLQKRGTSAGLGSGGAGSNKTISLESVMRQAQELRGDPAFDEALKRLLTALGDTSIGDTLSLLIRAPKSKEGSS